MICLLRKQPHNDFHYRTWNWFCYDNCCCWEFVSKEMAPSYHYWNSISPIRRFFIIFLLQDPLFVEIPKLEFKKVDSAKETSLSKYIEKLERLCNFRFYNEYIVFISVFFSDLNDKSRYSKQKVSDGPVHYIEVWVYLKELYYRVTWSISRFLSRDGVFFHSIFIRKPFNLSPCSI